jgi:hypothetical protein
VRAWAREYAVKDVMVDRVEESLISLVSFCLVVLLFAAEAIIWIHDRSYIEAIAAFFTLTLWELFLFAPSIFRRLKRLRGQLRPFGQNPAAGSMDDLSGSWMIFSSAILIAGLTGWGYFTATNGVAHHIKVGIISFVIGVVVLIGLVFLSVVLMIPVTDQLWRRISPQIRFFGEAASLSNLLDDVMTPAEVGDLGERRELMSRINQLARIVERDFANQLGLKIMSSRVAYDRMLKAAAYIRALETWLALPQQGTIQQLSIELRRLALLVVRGEFHYLPQAEIEAIAQRLLNKLTQFLTGLFVAILPLSSLLLTEEVAGVRLRGEVHSTWVTASIIWIAVTLLTTFDRTFGEKLSATQNILSLVRTGGRNSPT